MHVNRYILHCDRGVNFCNTFKVFHNFHHILTKTEIQECLCLYTSNCERSTPLLTRTGTRVNVNAASHTSQHPLLAEIQSDSLSMPLSIKTAEQGGHNSHCQRANTSHHGMAGNASRAHAALSLRLSQSQWLSASQLLPS